MERFSLEIIIFTVLVASCCGASKDAIVNELVNKQVTMTVDLATHLPKVTSSVTLENTGQKSVSSFLVAIDPSLIDHLSHIGAVDKSADEDQKLKVEKTSVANEKGKTFYRINLGSSLGAGKETTVDVETYFTHSLKAYPSEIMQAEKQYMQFTGSVYFYSPYKTTSQSTVVNCASNVIESYTKVKPVSVSESTISYGAYENLEPFSQKEMVVHYENNNPFLTVTHMTRLVEVSHWGNVAIEETIDIIHSGALLKGPFSRYDYQRSQDGVSSIKSFKTVLPAAAKDVYYRDEIGNISTSALREMDDSVEVELRPRFPLFGGWKTHYLIGYNVPSYQYLYNSGDQYVLKMRMMDHIYDDQVVDHLTLKVILPEGVGNIKFESPYPVKRDADERLYTYLDTMGRTVIVAHKDNMVEQHMQDFQLHYTFAKVMLLQEPLLVVGAFYLLFIILIIYVRMDFSITKDEASESRLRIASLIEQVQAAQDRRSALYQSYDDAINKYKTSKDNASFTGQRKRVDADHKALTQQIAGLQAKLKAEGADVSEKVGELQRLDAQAREGINLAIQYAEKLISSKMNKQQYVDVETSVRAKKEDILQKMETLLSSL